MTSTAFGGWVKSVFPGSAIGHWGTLDPTASGVLVLGIGYATRLLPLIEPATKRYSFELILGTKTDTADATGRVVETQTVPDDWRGRLPATAAALIGTIEQTPPMYSAVKVGGRPLYDSARRGEEVARQPRSARVLALGVVDSGRSSARMLVECDAGLYVRTLCEEIAQRLGTVGHMGALVRTAAGPFSIDDAALPEQIAQRRDACLIDPLGVLGCATVELNGERLTRFMHGNGMAIGEYDATVSAPPGGAKGTVLVVHGNRVIGVASLEEGQLSPRRVFPE
ncbi:MAG: tRNA pseudouridine(55) synthase TruB [Candidatus Eremiobacteraeota bacterium]|nr:tRNA pseudouridine(55) synthase TruB [Candidatus Eremiobacteraeota bacterium]MBV8365609.1 tRNA pseudouridine(55) synthase TruB [Candidatus Eremiobacteraeota bacterium]